MAPSKLPSARLGSRRLMLEYSRLVRRSEASTLHFFFDHPALPHNDRSWASPRSPRVSVLVYCDAPTCSTWPASYRRAKKPRYEFVSRSPVLTSTRVDGVVLRTRQLPMFTRSPSAVCSRRVSSD